MAYCTLTQLRDRIGEPMLVQLTDRGEVPTGQVDAGVVAAAQADADALIDGYLRGRYALPLAAVPPIVAALSATITLYKLHLTEPAPNVRRDFEDALRQLEKIAAGVIVVSDATGDEPAGVAGSGVRTTDRDRPFTAANLKGFV